MPKKALNNQTKRHLKEIILLFSVPVGIIVFIIAFLYVPRLFANPTYDFIYCEGYSCDNRLAVDQSGKLAVSADTDRYSYYNDYSLHYYDAQRDTTRPLHIDEAIRYQLDATSKSPDGYTLNHSSGGGGLLFLGNYHDSWSLSKGIISQPVTLDARSSDNKFIGWVIQ